MTSPWVKPLRAVPGARARLLCIPYAGGGAWAYRTWPPGLPADVEVLGVQPPGREDRLMEPPIAEMGALVAELAPVVEPLTDRPWAVFGHSMGALIGFELIRALARRGARPASHLFASGYRAPQVPGDVPLMTDLDDAAFVEEVNRRYDAVPPAARESEELMELVLPGLRADIAVCDVYAYAEGEPLPCPITALGGTGDANVPRAHLEAWGEQSGGPFELKLIEGGHFFLQSAQAEVVGIVASRLAGLGG